MKKIISIAKRLMRPLWVKLSGGLLLFFLLLDALFPLNTRVDYSSIITATDGTILHAFLNRQDKWRMYAELSEITPALRKAIVYKEDRYFYYHPGINPLALIRATGKNLISGRRTSGASTITMQVVRLLEPKSRTYTSKLIEAFRALQLELHYSKEEILQLYLNLIPYGSNIEGLKSASLLYFGKSPKLLSLAEITTLTIIPNRPSSLRLGVNNAYVVQERNRWLQRFKNAEVFDAPVIADALAEPLTARRREAPQQAPHLARRLKKENPGIPIIQATVLPAVQAATEQLVQNYINRMQALNIQNAAVLVINNQTMQVEAYIGSADFTNTQDGGQVDGVRAVRSPGSTLKPMLYALAFDKGLITPKTKLNDVPTNFGGYEPGNYDQRFNGAITAEFALANSLNIPAVKLLKEIGTPTFTSLLQRAAFTTVKKQSKDLGLSMILGGCGVTLEEMTRLFTVFAQEGRLKNSHLTVSTTNGEGPQLISPEAAFLVTNTLTQITRPDLPNNFDNSYHLPRIAWKTGTSYGRRDAWSIGYNKQYTVGVWMGNFSGEGVPELSGANTATPLLFQIFNTIDYNSPKGWFHAPKGLASRVICPESGDVPGESCTGRAVDYFIMGVTNYQRCQHQKLVFTNPAGTISYCAHCLPDSGYVQRLYPNLSPELIAYYELKHIPYEAIPVHNPACDRLFESGAGEQTAPFIASPNDRSEYFIDPKNPADMQLSCQTGNEVRTVYWYLNDKLYRKAKPNEAVFFKPWPGRLRISCADDRGRHSDIQILIRSL